MIQYLVEGLQSLPPEAVKVILLLSAFVCLLVMLRLFGAAGVTVYLSMALVAANLHVLKAVQFSWFQDPVALGTVLFATTFLGSDILNEYYGAKQARRAVMLSFAAFILMTLFMILCIGIRPLSEPQAGEDWRWAYENHQHMQSLFLPVPAILVAGLIAYLGSQILDIWLYQRIRQWSGNRHRWLRNNLSTWVSAFVDSTLFSLLAWIVLAEHPLPLPVVWKTYIVGTWFIRVAVALCDTPFLYLAAWCVPPEDRARNHNPAEK